MARFANTIDNQPIYAARAEADKNGDRIDTTYAKLTDIPTIPVTDVEVDGTSVVNASGVAEITMPTIPTATSDLTNDSGYITASDVAANQEQADWTESDPTDAAYIQHKPAQKPLVAGQNVVLTEGANNITIDCTASGGGSTYTAGNGISISAQDVISVDTSVVATQTDLAGKQATLTAGSNVTITNNVISATDTTYTAGDGIDITNSEISVDYDSDTLEMKQLPPVTHSSYLTSYTSTGAANQTYGETPVEIIDQLRTVAVTVSIPGNTFYSWYTGGQSAVAVIVFKTNSNDYVDTGAYSDIPLSYTQDTTTGKYWLDEQEVEVTTLVGNATPNYFTFGFFNGALSSDVWNCDTASLSDPIIFSYSTASGEPELAVKNPLPASAVGDSGKVLTVNSSGAPVWATSSSGGVQADWTEADPSDPSYIQNKPSLATVATSGSYNDLSNTPTINNVPAVTSSDDAKVLKASYSGGVGSYSWETATAAQVNSDWDATSGVAEILNKPDLVDIVAGTGVRFVEDTQNNRVVAEVDETVLYDCSNNYVYGTNSVTLSESYKNFEVIKILNSKGNVQFFYPANNQSVSKFTLYSIAEDYLWLIPWTFTSDTVFSGSTGKLWTVGTTTAFDVASTAGFNRWIQPIKVVGVNRIASN